MVGKRIIRLLAPIISWVCFSAPAAALSVVMSVHTAPLTLPSVFSDHMVLQRQCPVPVWGSATPGAAVTVEFAGQKITDQADASGKWRMDLDSMESSFEPRTMVIVAGGERVEFRDVLVGEVWLCSGQSNMKWKMSDTDTAPEDIAGANRPHIRLYDTPLRLAGSPDGKRINASWMVCTPQSVGAFSGVAYHFGRKLHEDLNVPIGLLVSAYGGTKIELWTPLEEFGTLDSLADIYQQALNLPPITNEFKLVDQLPTVLYNGMIYPHIPYSIRGVIWYQGESNRLDGDLYVDKTRALLNGWRRLWGYDFPFYFVQIAPYQGTSIDLNPYNYPLFWEAQAQIAETIPGAGMAVVSDATTLNNIHPPNKKIPGERLALLAEAHTYGIDVICSGPTFESMEAGEDALTATFSSADGLTTRDGLPPDWFEICGTNGVFKTAETEISGRRVILRSPGMQNPQAVRFAWHKLATPNLMNAAGLPAVSFRAGNAPEPIRSTNILYSAVQPANNVAVSHIPENKAGWGCRNSSTVGRRDLGQSFLATNSFTLSAFTFQISAGIREDTAQAPVTMKVFESSNAGVIGSVISSTAGTYLSWEDKAAAGGWVTFDIDDVEVSTGKYYTVLITWNEAKPLMEQGFYLEPSGFFEGGQAWTSANGERYTGIASSPAGGTPRDAVFIIHAAN